MSKNGSSDTCSVEVNMLAASTKCAEPHLVLHDGRKRQRLQNADEDATETLWKAVNHNEVGQHIQNRYENQTLHQTHLEGAFS